MTHELVRKGPLACLVASSLKRFDFLSHAFCTRQGGASSGPYAAMNMSPAEGDDPARVDQNWRTLAQAFDLDSDCFFLLRQVHGEDVLILDRSFHRETFSAPPAYDATITDQPNLALCVKTADCVPVFLVDPSKRVIANIHAGWKGTARNIAGKVVATLVERFGSQVSDLLAVIGPAIGPCCYEVDDPVVAALEDWRDIEDICRPSLHQNRWMLDLPRLNQAQLIRSGLAAQQISRIDLCTSCREDLFFSHRRDRGHTGRQVHFIMLKDEMAGPVKNA